MVSWYHPLYLSEGAAGTETLIKYRFKYKKYPGDYYYIILPEGQDMPEMIRAAYLKQPYYESINFTVIGAALYKKEVYDLFTRIVQDAYDATKDVNIRKFLKL